MLVTPDDFVRLKERILDSRQLANEYAMLVFDRLVADIQPRLVITEPGGAAEWYEKVILTRSTIASGTRGVSPAMLDGVAAVASKYLRLLGPEPQREFPFMHSPELRAVAQADWTRLVAAAQREDGKTAAIAAGSVVEAVALDLLEQLPNGEAAKLRDHLNRLKPAARRDLFGRGDLHEWSFAFLLLALSPLGLDVLSERAHAIGHNLRDWRNLVHPHLARRESAPSAADGRLAAGLAEKVIEDVEAWSKKGRPLVVPT